MAWLSQSELALTGAMPRPRAGCCRRRTSSSLRNQGSRRTSGATRKVQVLCKSCHQVVTHRPQSAEVGDVVIAESAAREYGVTTREQNVFPQLAKAHVNGMVPSLHVTSTSPWPAFPFKSSLGKQVRAMSHEASPITSGSSPSESP